MMREQNVVWTMLKPFHFATQLLTAWKDLVQTLHLPRQSLQKVATPAGSQALRIPRYGIQKFNVSTCFNDFQWFSMYVSLAPGGMLRFRVPLCSAGTTGWWWAWVMQNTMGKGPNLSPWGLVNERPRKKMWERRRHRKPWALAMRREMRRVTWRKVARWSERGGVEWLSGKELGGSLEEMNPYQSVHDKLRVWQLDCSTSLAKARKNMKKIKLATTSFRDKTLFKRTASASTGSGGPCNEHRQKAKSCGLNYEILMFHCFTVTICRINTSSALWFTDTQWQQLRQWWGSKMS